MPTLSASVSDQDGDPIVTTFTLHDYGMPVWSGTKSVAGNASGATVGTASIQVPSDIIVDGDTYTLAVTSSDSTTSSSSSTTFIADTGVGYPVTTCHGSCQTVNPQRAIRDLSAGPLAAGQTTLLTLPSDLVSQDPEAADIVVTAAGRGSIGTGGIVVYDTNFPAPQRAITVAAPGTAVGVTTWSGEVGLSDDDYSFAVKNASTVSLDVSVAVTSTVNLALSSDLAADQSEENADPNTPFTDLSAEQDLNSFTPTSADLDALTVNGVRPQVDDSDGVESCAPGTSNAAVTCTTSLTATQFSAAISPTANDGLARYPVSASQSEMNSIDMLESEEQVATRDDAARCYSPNPTAWHTRSRFYACRIRYYKLEQHQDADGGGAKIGELDYSVTFQVSPYLHELHVGTNVTLRVNEAKGIYAIADHNNVKVLVRFFCRECYGPDANHYSGGGSYDYAPFGLWNGANEVTFNDQRDINFGGYPVVPSHSPPRNSDEIALHLLNSVEFDACPFDSCARGTYLVPDRTTPDEGIEGDEKPTDTPDAEGEDDHPNDPEDGGGLTYDDFVPTIAYSRAPDSGVSEVADHIFRALAGKSMDIGNANGGPPLIKYVWVPGPNDKPHSKSPNTKGKDALCRRERAATSNYLGDCDEYPFQSVRQGCFHRVTCSVRIVDSTENSRAGQQLMIFYKNTGSMTGDKFYVLITN